MPQEHVNRPHSRKTREGCLGGGRQSEREKERDRKKRRQVSQKHLPPVGGAKHKTGDGGG